MTKQEETKIIYVVMNNTDGTEGRGEEYAYCVCESIATAVRFGHRQYVQGSDCPIKTMECVQVDGKWYAPISALRIRQPSKEDLHAQEVADRKAMLINRARTLGLSDSEIEEMQGLAK